MLKEIIGAKLVDINNSFIIVEKDEKHYKLNIIDTEGSCCGYNEITTKLLITDNSKPVITNIKEEKDSEGDVPYYCKITFFGDYKPLAILESYSTSGSGYGYGATVSIECEKLNVDEVLTSW